MVDIVFVNETHESIEEWVPLLTRVIEKTIEQEGISKDKEVSVIFVTPDRIQELNRDYRGHDRVTDVISFALNDTDDTIVGVELPILGDIFVCLEVARQQAVEYGHTLERELGFLVCHGLLHLLGYDHMTPEEEADMFSKQEAVLNALNLNRKGGSNDQ